MVGPKIGFIRNSTGESDTVGEMRNERHAMTSKDFQMGIVIIVVQASRLRIKTKNVRSVIHLQYFHNKF